MTSQEFIRGLPGEHRTREREPSNADERTARVEHDLHGLAAGLGHRLQASGIHDALAWLNARVRFRYTGLYRREPPLLRVVHLVDRENPTLNVSGGAAPLSDTYCSITCEFGRPFRTTDARRDPRLQSHPARESVVSYVGVPVRASSGLVIGTLCHWDSRPRLIPPAEIRVLEAAVPAFAAWLQAAGCRFDPGR